MQSVLILQCFVRKVTLFYSAYHEHIVRYTYVYTVVPAQGCAQDGRPHRVPPTNKGLREIQRASPPASCLDYASFLVLAPFKGQHPTIFGCYIYMLKSTTRSNCWTIEAPHFGCSLRWPVLRFWPPTPPWAPKMVVKGGNL